MAPLLKAAIIGCGKIARDMHLPALQYHADKVEVVGFCSASLASAQRLAQAGGTPGALVTDHPEDIFGDKGIDLVHVCSPNATHRDLVVAALRAGKHVMCDKPMAHTAAAAKEMCDAARETGRLLSVSCQNRFRSDSLAVHRWCESGELGELYYARAHAVRRMGVPSWGAFTQKAAQGGGALLDIGTHALDLALWHLDDYDIQSVSAVCFDKLKQRPDGNIFGPWDPDRFEVEDSAFGFIRTKSGRAIYLEAAWALHAARPQEAVAAVYGTLGGATQTVERREDGTAGYRYRVDTVKHGELVTIAPDYAEANRRVTGQAESEVLVAAPRRMMAAWLDAILQGAPLVVTAEQAYSVTRVIEAFYRSAEAGREVLFEDV